MSNQQQNIRSEERILKVKEGIDFIFKLIEIAGQRPFPRKMTTKVSDSKMFTVTKKEEVLQSCIDSEFLDCRINAYPIYPDDDIEAGLIAPTIVFIDIDKNILFSDDIHLILQNTLNKIKYTFDLHSNSSPYAVLWTGGGYHIYLVVKTKPMVIYPDLAKLCKPDSEVSKEFLRFCEKFFTDRKGDPNHNISFKSALLRIPGTLNYKRLCCEPDTAEVKVIYEPVGSEGVTMKVGDNFHHSFTYWCMDVKRVQILKENERKRIIRQQQKIKRYSGYRKIDLEKKYWWIEQLLDRQIDHNRYFCIWRILGPYLITIKKLPYEEAYNILQEWLKWCSELKPFDNMHNRITSGLQESHNYNPLSLNTVRRLNIKEKGAYRNILNAIEK